MNRTGQRRGEDGALVGGQMDSYRAEENGGGARVNGQKVLGRTKEN